MALLDQITIASPCAADWHDMQGDDRRRFCAQCKLHVHDLRAMTRDEAEALLQAAGQGRVCVRLHRRADGRVLTRDCPVGLRQRLRAAWARAAALALAMWGAATACVRSKAPAVSPPPVVPARVHQGEVALGDVRAPEPVVPVPVAPSPPEVLQGKVKLPSTPPKK